MKNFRTYNLAIQLYQACEELPIKGHQRDQLLRASLSVCLNLAEGSAKQTDKERRRFYYIALGSQRECHCILILKKFHSETQMSDHLGACLFKLIQAIRC